MGRSLADLYAEVETLALKAGVTRFPRPEDHGQDERVWLEEGPPGLFSKRYVERGKISVVAEGGYDRVLFEVMRSLAQDMAVAQELAERGSGPYSRRKWFGIQRDLMAGMKSEFAPLIAADQAQTLALHPYQDDK